MPKKIFIRISFLLILCLYFAYQIFADDITATLDQSTDDFVIEPNTGETDSPTLRIEDVDNNALAIRKLQDGSSDIKNEEGAINFKTSNDSDDYISLYTSSNEVYITAEGIDYISLPANKTFRYNSGTSVTNDYDLATKKYVDDSISTSSGGWTDDVAIVRLTTLTDSVGIGTASPNASAKVDITSTTLGFLIPRMTTAQKNAIASPAAGLQVYDTTASALFYYNGVSWVELEAAVNTLAGLSDADISSPAEADILIYDGTDSWDNKALSGDVTVAADGTTAITAGTIVNADVNDAAAIGWSKVSKTSSSLADLATRNYSDLSGRPSDDDMHALSAEATIADNDEVLIYDTSASAYKKMTRANLVNGLLADIAWGDISGTLSNQSDLQSALDGKEDTLSKSNLTASSPVSVSNSPQIIGSSVANISISQANGTTNGYLSSTDWNTFNDKQDSLSLPLSVSDGGTGKSLTASNGGIVYTDADSLEVLSGTATAQKVLMSQASSAPVWSTATYPLTSTLNRIIRGDGTNWVTSTCTWPDSASANQAIYANGSNTVTAGTLPVAAGGTGQTSYTNGQLLIGNTTGNTLTKATLTGTTNQITVTNGTGSITLSTPQNISTDSTPTFLGANLNGATYLGYDSDSALGYIYIPEGTFLGSAYPIYFYNYADASYNAYLSFDPSLGSGLEFFSFSHKLSAPSYEGTWAGNAIGVSQGGTGLASFTANALLYASATDTLATSSQLVFTTSVGLSVDGNSNTRCLRLLGTDAANEIADMYLGAIGNFVIDLTAGNDSSQYLDIKTEDDAYGIIIRNSAGTSTVWGNIYMNDDTVDWLNITCNVVGTTPILTITDNDRIGILTKVPAEELTLSSSSAIGWEASAGTVDTNLYRSSADVLKTDDTFQAGGYRSSSGSDGITQTIEFNDADWVYHVITVENGLIIGHSCCFLEGTSIKMANGQTKNIEDIKTGDLVLSYDINNKKQVNKKVTKLEAPIRNHYYFVSFDDKTALKVTDEHPIYTDKGWKCIDPNSNKNKDLNVTELKLGDRVKTSTGFKKIIGWVKVTGKFQTYNLRDIEDTHTFYADDVLVHNKCLIGETLIKTPKGLVHIKDLKIGDSVYGYDNQGNLIVTEILYLYKKETLEKLKGKILREGVIATNNHIIKENGKITAVGNSQYPDITLDCAVYDIKTKCGNYIINGEIISVCDEGAVF